MAPKSVAHINMVRHPGRSSSAAQDSALAEQADGAERPQSEPQSKGKYLRRQWLDGRVSSRQVAEWIDRSPKRAWELLRRESGPESERLKAVPAWVWAPPRAIDDREDG